MPANHLFLKSSVWLSQLRNFSVSQIDDDLETFNLLSQGWNGRWHITLCLPFNLATNKRGMRCWHYLMLLNSLWLGFCLLTFCLLVNFHHTTIPQHVTATEDRNVYRYTYRCILHPAVSGEQKRSSGEDSGIARGDMGGMSPHHSWKFFQSIIGLWSLNSTRFVTIYGYVQSNIQHVSGFAPRPHRGSASGPGWGISIPQIPSFVPT